MCRGGIVVEDGAAREEDKKRKTSEKIYGCGEGGRAERDGRGSWDRVRRREVSS